LVLEALVFLRGAGEEKGIGHLGFALRDLGDDVAAADPMSLGEIGGRPLRRVVGMGVIEAGDVETLFGGFALDLYQFNGSNVVAVMRLVGSCVSRAHRRRDQPSFSG